MILKSQNPISEFYIFVHLFLWIQFSSSGVLSLVCLFILAGWKRNTLFEFLCFSLEIIENGMDFRIGLLFLDCFSLKLNGLNLWLMDFVVFLVFFFWLGVKIVSFCTIWVLGAKWEVFVQVGQLGIELKFTMRAPRGLRKRGIQLRALGSRRKLNLFRILMWVLFVGRLIYMILVNCICLFQGSWSHRHLLGQEWTRYSFLWKH